MFCAEQGEGPRSHRPRIDVTRMRHNERADAALPVLDLAMSQQILHRGLEFVSIGFEQALAPAKDQGVKS
jgi:hypothetical protein